MKTPLIAITRTIQQSNFLHQEIIKNGWQSLISPLICIEELNSQNFDFLALQNINLNDYFAIIFISPNAVNFSMKFLLNKLLNNNKIHLVAIGESTAKTIKNYNLNCIINPKTNSAESVLELDIFAKNNNNFDNKKILWLRGTSGKNDVINILKNRNFLVEVISCYQKKYTTFESNFALLKALTMQEISALIIHSSDSLAILQKYILQYIKNNFANEDFDKILNIVLKTPLFVIHQNISKKAKEFSWKNVILCQTNDYDLILNLQKFLL